MHPSAPPGAPPNPLRAAVMDAIFTGDPRAIEFRTVASTRFYGGSLPLLIAARPRERRPRPRRAVRRTRGAGGRRRAPTRSSAGDDDPGEPPSDLAGQRSVGRPPRAAIRQGIHDRIALRHHLDRLTRGISAVRRRPGRPATDLAAIWNLRCDAAGSTDALGERIHDGRRDCPPALQAAIDAGDRAEVRRIEAAVLDRELGPGTGRLYAEVLEQVDLAHALALELADRLAAEVVRARRRKGQSLAGLCERVVVHDGRGGTRIEPQRSDP